MNIRIHNFPTMAKQNTHILNIENTFYTDPGNDQASTQYTVICANIGFLPFMPNLSVLARKKISAPDKQ